MRIVLFSLLFAMMMLLWPTRSLSASGKGITARVVTAEERHACKYLGLVTKRKAIGWNKTGGALTSALREVQAMGGDSLYIVTEHQDPFAGASVNGEALKCHSEPSGAAQ